MDEGGEEGVGGGLAGTQSRGQLVALRQKDGHLRHDTLLFGKRRDWNLEERLLLNAYLVSGCLCHDRFHLALPYGSLKGEVKVLSADCMRIQSVECDRRSEQEFGGFRLY